MLTERDKKQMEKAKKKAEADEKKRIKELEF